MFILKFLNDNKTKITGLLLLLISYFQANPTFASLMGARAFEVTVMVFGAIVLVLGFINPQTPKPPTEGS